MIEQDAAKVLLERVGARVDDIFLDIERLVHITMLEKPNNSIYKETELYLMYVMSLTNGMMERGLDKINTIKYLEAIKRVAEHDHSGDKEAYKGTGDTEK